MNLITRLRRNQSATGERDLFSDWTGYVQYVANGNTYLVPNTTINGVKQPQVAPDFPSLVQQVNRYSSVAEAAVSKRSALVSEIDFVWQRPDEGRFTASNLAKLQSPAPDMTRRGMLALMEMHASYAGTAYVYDQSQDPQTENRGGLRVLRPDLVDVMIGSDQNPDEASTQLDGEIVGYVYWPNGRHSTGVRLDADMVAQWAPEPDPLAWWRGRSWVASVIREIAQDYQVTSYVDKFFENAATVNMVLKTPPQVTDPTQFKEWVDAFEDSHSGTRNAWRNIYLGAGAEAMPVGSNLQDIALKDLRGEVESRIAARSQVPATILGVPSSAVSGGSALNAGNYLQVRRTWADTWFSPYAATLCESLQKLLDPLPEGGPATLSYNPASITFLQEDERDAADIARVRAETVALLIREGFTPESAIRAIESDDMALLEHTGLVSVQLQPPGNTIDADGLAEAPEATDSDADADGRQEVLDLTVAAQRVYLAVVNKVLTQREAREILNRLGAGVPVDELPPELLDGFNAAQAMPVDDEMMTPPEGTPDE